jgi:hypothetical protein
LDPISPNVNSASLDSNLSAIDSLPMADREKARQQGVCPVTRKPLGSMGIPVRLEINGREVFLCCSGCEDKLRLDPSRYLDDPSGMDHKKP